MAELSQIVKEVMESRFSVTQHVEKDICNFDLFVKDEYYPVGSEGCIGLWTGRQKSRKTFALNCTIASAVKGSDVGPFRYKPNGGIIVHFDTEQPRNRYLISQRNLYKIGGLDLSYDRDRYFSFNLRKYDWGTRTAIINQILLHFIAEKIKIDLICIDGVVDICENFNENVAASKTSQDIMTWSDRTQASIYGVLHTNKTGGEVRGHLGTELSNKTDFTIEVRKKNDDDVFSQVLSKDSRYFPFKSFEIYQDKTGMIDLSRGSWQSEDMIFGGEEVGEDLPF
jgi:hypothetical protein